MHDVIIIGGSFAGLAAAIQLGRARRAVLVLDTGKPRNRFSPAAHGIVGHDGTPPLDLLAEARAQMAPYRTIAFQPAEATALSGALDRFTVSTRAHGTLESRRIILAHGITDTLPAIHGLAECWGLSVLHCPYCHGFEYGDRRLGFLAVPGFESMMGRLYRDWSTDLVMFANGQAIAPEVRTELEGLGIAIAAAPIRELRHRDGLLTHVVTDDGTIERDAIFVAPRTAPSLDLHLAMGCAVEPGHSGDYIRVDERQETTVKGIFAAGDLARPMHNVTLAMAGGAVAGAMAHHSLLFTPGA